jgi:hypothetical protein
LDSRYSAKAKAAFDMVETESFFNAGYGWVCKRCALLQTEAHKCSSKNKDALSIKRAPASLAQWLDDKRRVLYCPCCGAQEEVDRT